MIPRIICFIFGHTRREKAYAGMADPDMVDVLGRRFSLYDYKYFDFCPRCGVKLAH